MDLVKTITGNAIVPTYVLDYLLGQYAVSDEEETIKAGIEAVRRILAQHYVHRNEAELVKSIILRHGWYWTHLLNRSAQKMPKKPLDARRCITPEHIAP